MLVAEILKSKGERVYTASPSDTLAQVAAQLHERRVGAVVVLNGQDDVAGIVSERDIVRSLATDGAEALQESVAQCMSAQVIFAEPSETIDALLARMTDRRIRHLPVCKAGRLVGIVSIGDLVKVKIAEAEAEARTLKDYITAG